MLVKICSNRDYYTAMVGVQITTVTLETSVSVSIKVKHSLPYSPDIHLNKICAQIPRHAQNHL